MRINEYKNDVGSLKLTPEFKENLKALMAEEYEKQKGSPEKSPEETLSRPAIFAKKYSKYFALAACLLLAVSTVGVMSLMRLATKPADLSDAAEEAGGNAELFSAGSDDANAAAILTDGEIPAEDASAEDTPDLEEDSESLIGSDDAEVPASEEAEDVDEVLYEPGDEEPQPSETNPASDYGGDNNPMSNYGGVNPTSGNGYSNLKSRDYDGDYDGEMYVAYNVAGDGEITAKNVVTTAKLKKRKVSPAVSSSDENIETESTAQTDPTVPAETPMTAVDEEVEAEDTGEAVTIDEETFGNLTEGYSVKYYDVRDGTVANLDNVALIRFRILDAYSGSEISANTDREVTIDPDKETLYKINVGYDYFESEDPDVVTWMINVGNESYQLIGRPVMQGEYVAVATVNTEGVVELVPELVYAVHNVGGLDIAYHVYSDEGFMVDPGDTNMGIMPEELEFTTTTSNNPEIYTQKAAVRELTSYLRRNILRMEPTLAELSEEPPEPTVDENGNELLKTIAFKYYAGKGVYDAEANTVNGVGVGTKLEDALEPLMLTKYSFSKNCVMTLVAADEDGGWTAVITFADGVVSSVEYKG